MRSAQESETPRPVILAVVDEPSELSRIERELQKRYGTDYRVVCEGSGEAALEVLRSVNAAGAEVAVILADQRLPGMSGTEFLGRARQLYSTSKRALLIPQTVMRWDDPLVGTLFQAMALGHVDYFVPKPSRTPDESFHEPVGQFLAEWSRAQRPAFVAIRIIGQRAERRSHELRDLCNRNSVPHEFFPANSKEGRELLARVGESPERLPVVILHDGQVLVDPSNQELADAFGANVPLEERKFDVVVVGAGPAGLAAAVYGASEGLDTLVLESEAFGGQAGTSSLIRNYLGFPWGIGGAELAVRAYQQAAWFGATFRFMYPATALRREADALVVTLSDGTEVSGRAVILATGASYRRLDVPSLEALVGAGVSYGAALAEAQAMEGQAVYIVGGANSAGQAAVHLSKYASKVTLLVRGNALGASMSDYLIREIEAADNVEVRLDTRVVGGGGEGRLERLVLSESSSGRTVTVSAAALFVLIGSRPHTEWLPEDIERDDGGFVVTGSDLLLGDGGPPRGWPLDRPPLLLESSLPGVFAAGDVRHRSIKRMASAVGEGSIAIQLVHEYLSDR